MNNKLKWHAKAISLLLITINISWYHFQNKEHSIIISFTMSNLIFIIHNLIGIK